MVEGIPTRIQKELTALQATTENLTIEMRSSHAKLRLETKQYTDRKFLEARAYADARHLELTGKLNRLFKLMTGKEFGANGVESESGKNSDAVQPAIHSSFKDPNVLIESNVDSSTELIENPENTDVDDHTCSDLESPDPTDTCDECRFPESAYDEFNCEVDSPDVKIGTPADREASDLELMFATSINLESKFPGYSQRKSSSKSEMDEVLDSFFNDHNQLTESGGDFDQNCDVNFVPAIDETDDDLEKEVVQSYNIIVADEMDLEFADFEMNAQLSSCNRRYDPEKIEDVDSVLLEPDPDPGSVLFDDRKDDYERKLQIQLYIAVSGNKEHEERDEHIKILEIPDLIMLIQTTLDLEFDVGEASVNALTVQPRKKAGDEEDFLVPVFLNSETDQQHRKNIFDNDTNRNSSAGVGLRKEVRDQSEESSKACSSREHSIRTSTHLSTRETIDGYAKEDNVSRDQGCGEIDASRLSGSLENDACSLQKLKTGRQQVNNGCTVRHKELEEATDNFQALLGQGAPASVFKGILTNGTSVAVKRIDGEEHGEKEFRSEVAAIASVQHVNLLHLMGYCCLPGGPRFLVYEFMPNGSLDYWIFPRKERETRNHPGGCLSWDLRYRVAIDVAKALSYLHHDCRSRILHLDVKPENILLDANYRAIVADFGLSKLMGKDESRVITTMRGTRGYLAPEWLLELGVSEKSDTYNYGMVLLEMIGGQRNVSLIENGTDRTRRKWQFSPKIVRNKLKEGKLIEAVDQRMVEAGVIDDGRVYVWDNFDSYLLCLVDLTAAEALVKDPSLFRFLFMDWHGAAAGAPFLAQRQIFDFRCLRTSIFSRRGYCYEPDIPEIRLVILPFYNTLVCMKMLSQ